MTEQEWMGCTVPTPMLDAISTRASDRKLRLFACACMRRACSRMANGGEIPEELVLAEHFCDGLASSDDLGVARSRLGARGGYSAAWAANNILFGVLDQSAEVAARRAINYLAAFTYLSAVEEEGRSIDEAKAANGAEIGRSLEVLRDIVGPLPFRTVAVNPPWRSSTVVPMAEGIYTERAFDRLPILADALEDAGCDDRAILNHCRDGGPHVRGCWVVDLLLRKN